MYKPVEYDFEVESVSTPACPLYAIFNTGEDYGYMPVVGLGLGRYHPVKPEGKHETYVVPMVIGADGIVSAALSAAISARLPHDAQMAPHGLWYSSSINLSEC